MNATSGLKEGVEAFRDMRFNLAAPLPTLVGGKCYYIINIDWGTKRSNKREAYEKQRPDFFSLRQEKGTKNH